MNRISVLSAAGVLAALAFASGCDMEPTIFSPDLEPNTRISAGPPEATDTGYNVNLFWFGWDDDGFISHYEIAWETPDNWIGPIFTNDSLFLVQASDSCCVEPLPEFEAPRDSIYEQFHTFYVRSVDNDGLADPTPAVRSFNSKTIAPITKIDDDFSPRDGGDWGTNAQFKWSSEDDDGVVVSYVRALANKEQFGWSSNDPITNVTFVRWLDTLQYVPTGPGQYSDSLIWQPTDLDSVVYPELPTQDGGGASHLYLFAVRAVDDAGATERILSRPRNVRRFIAKESVNGPLIFLRSNLAGSWRTGDPVATRGVFAGEGLRFNWRATPGGTGARVAGFSYAVDDTAQWTPFSPNAVEWPDQIEGDEESLWFPDPGLHSFFLRAIDVGGFISLLVAQLEIFEGPRFCASDERFIFVVLDTSTGILEGNGIWPTGYAEIERSLVDYWFESYNYQVFQTRGQEKPRIEQFRCASSMVWFVSSSIEDNDPSIMEQYHQNPPNPLPSYVAAGGNLFILGIRPVQGVNYFELNTTTASPPSFQGVPVAFQTTLTDTNFVPHWMATTFGIARINESISSTVAGGDAPRRLSVARARVPVYPDLNFDPLTWPNGPLQRGFGFYDRDIIPLAGSNTEVIYTANDTNLAVGVRNLVAPGIFGNTVFLGLHPYFVERPAFRRLVEAVMTDFGEVKKP